MWKQEFNYTGKTQVFDIDPCKLHNETFPTPYLLECYGAQGNSGTNGNYTKGILTIRKPTRLYLNIGGAGGNGANQYGWYSDGQGYSSYYNNYGYRCSGGSTDISLAGTDGSANWNESNHLNNILLRAQGGNGSSYTDSVSLPCPSGTRTCSLTGKGTYNPVTSNATSASGYVSSAKGQSGAGIVLTLKPNTTGTLTFYSSNPSGDPYGYVTGATSKGDDDSGGNRNFRISITVNAGSTYYLRCGAYSSGTASYNWYATFPSSTIAYSDSLTQQTTYTGANGRITNTLGTTGQYVIYFTPKVNGTLTFYSNSNTGDPYGRCTQSTYGTTSSDNYSGQNFRISITVHAGYTYYLYCGSSSSSTWTLGSPPVASYNWYATFPQSTVGYSTGNFTYNYTYYWTVTGGINNYPDIISSQLTETGSTAQARSGNGFIRITRLSPIPKNTNLRYDATSQESYDYERFMNYINTL